MRQKPFTQRAFKKGYIYFVRFFGFTKSKPAKICLVSTSFFKCQKVLLVMGRYFIPLKKG